MSDKLTHLMGVMLDSHGIDFSWLWMMIQPSSRRWSIPMSCNERALQFRISCMPRQTARGHESAYVLLATFMVVSVPLFSVDPVRLRCEALARWSETSAHLQFDRGNPIGAVAGLSLLAWI